MTIRKKNEKVFYLLIWKDRQDILLSEKTKEQNSIYYHFIYEKRKEKETYKARGD